MDIQIFYLIFCSSSEVNLACYLAVLYATQGNEKIQCNCSKNISTWIPIKNWSSLRPDSAFIRNIKQFDGIWRHYKCTAIDPLWHTDARWLTFRKMCCVAFFSRFFYQQNTGSAMKVFLIFFIPASSPLFPRCPPLFLWSQILLHYFFLYLFGADEPPVWIKIHYLEF